jgi:hypothetical protein
LARIPSRRGATTASYRWSSKIALGNVATEEETLVAADALHSHAGDGGLYLAGNRVFWLEQATESSGSHIKPARLKAWDTTTKTTQILLELLEPENAEDDNADGRTVDWSLEGVSQDHLLFYFRDVDATTGLGTRSFRVYDPAGDFTTILQLDQDDWRGKQRATLRLVGDLVVFRHPTENYYVLHDVTTGAQRQVLPLGGRIRIPAGCKTALRPGPPVRQGSQNASSEKWVLPNGRHCAAQHRPAISPYPSVWSHS